MLGHFFEQKFIFRHCRHKFAINVRNHTSVDDIKSSQCYGDLVFFSVYALRLAERTVQ
jgi:hypothetical protein